MKKTIITIARSYGSGGRTLGIKLAEELGIPCYDRNIIRIASDESGVNEQLFGEADEKVTGLNIFKGTKPYTGELLPPGHPDYTSRDNLFNIEAQTIKNLAEKGPCIFVGRCADYVLGDYSNVVNTFIYAYKDDRINRIMDIYKLSEKEAVDKIKKIDRERRLYYEGRTDRKWGSIEANAILLNSSLLGIDGAVDALEAIYHKWENR